MRLAEWRHLSPFQTGTRAPGACRWSARWRHTWARGARRGSSLAAWRSSPASAWFNRGFLSHDEHFQILEFAWYKLGRAPSNTLAWEFREHMRPGLQPLMAAWATRGLEAVGLFSPFVLAFLLRLASGLLGVWVSLALAARVLPRFGSRLKMVLVAGSLFLWFLPSVHVRFSSDNWGGLLFFAGLCLLLDAVGDAGTASGAWRAGMPALLAPVTLAADGAGVSDRSSAAPCPRWGRRSRACAPPRQPACCGASRSTAATRSGSRSRAPGAGSCSSGAGASAVLGALAAAFLIACAAGTLADRWLYDAWVFTPYEYARANLIEGKAASFGVKPWWFYGGKILLYLVPPFSLVLVGLLGAAVWYVAATSSCGRRCRSSSGTA